MYSVTKGSPVIQENYPKFNEELGKGNIGLECNYKKITKEEKQNIWDELRSIILSKSGDIEDYWAASLISLWRSTSILLNMM